MDDSVFSVSPWCNSDLIESNSTAPPKYSAGNVANIRLISMVVVAFLVEANRINSEP